jgi:arsenate reductase
MADWPRNEVTAQRWIEAMVAAPELIQRPILLLDDGSAIIARTPEAVDEALRRVQR